MRKEGKDTTVGTLHNTETHEAAGLDWEVEDWEELGLLQAQKASLDDERRGKTF